MLKCWGIEYSDSKTAHLKKVYESQARNIQQFWMFFNLLPNMLVLSLCKCQYKQSIYLWHCCLSGTISPAYHLIRLANSTWQGFNLHMLWCNEVSYEQRFVWKRWCWYCHLTSCTITPPQQNEHILNQYNNNHIHMMLDS